MFKCFEDSLLKCLEEMLLSNDAAFDIETRNAWIRFNKFIFDQLERGMRGIEKEIEQREKIIADLKNAKLQ